MNKIPYFILITMLFFFLPGKSADCGTIYSLFDLSQLANEHSETIKIAKEDVYIAQQEKARAMSVLIPRATAYGRVTEYKDEDSLAPNSVTTGVNLTQSFTLNGKELIALDVTKRGIESREYSLESTRAQYLFQVAQAYYNILSAKRFLEIAESDVKRLEIHKAGVQEKLNVGNVTKTALYRAEAELSKAMTEKVIAQNRVMKTKAALRKLVDLDEEFDLQKGYIESIENYQSTLQEIQEYALAHRNEIKEAKKNLDIATKTISFEKSNYWPTVSLEAGYKESDLSYQTNSREVEYDNEDLYFTGELIFTLYDGGLRKAQIRQAAADQRKAQNILALQEKAIILDAENSFRDYTAAKSVLVNLEDELKSSKENYNAVQMQFKYGMADSIDMMDANTLLVSAQRRILDAKYTYYLSVLGILYTRGDLTQFLLNES